MTDKRSEMQVNFAFRNYNFISQTITVFDSFSCFCMIEMQNLYLLDLVKIKFIDHNDSGRKIIITKEAKHHVTVYKVAMS